MCSFCFLKTDELTFLWTRPYVRAKSTWSSDRFNAADYPAEQRPLDPAACGSCWLGAKGQEAVITGQVCEQEKQVRGESFGRRPAVTGEKKSDKPCSTPGWQRAYDKNQLVKPRVTRRKPPTTQAYAFWIKQLTFKLLNENKQPLTLPLAALDAAFLGSLCCFVVDFSYIPVGNWLTSWCQFEMSCSNYNDSFMHSRVVLLFQSSAQLYVRLWRPSHRI